MKIKLSLILPLLTLFVLVKTGELGLVENEILRNTDLKNELHESKLTCMKYFKSIFLKTILIFTGRWDDRQESESQTKCWFSCILKKMNIMNRNSTINLNEIDTRIGKMSQKGQQIANSNLPDCTAKTEAITDACDKAAEFVACMYQGAQKKQ